MPPAQPPAAPVIGPDETDAAAAMLGETLMMRLWLSNMNVGTVIGKGGANIKSIREKSSCRVSISEHVPHAPERMMTVTGSAQSLNTVIEMMLDAIEEAQAQHKASKAAENPEAAEAAAGEEAKETTHNLKLVMSNNQAGGIIGKAGANIKAMREESGAFIKVDASGTGGGPYDRLVIVNGTKASLIKAHLLLMFKVAEIPDESAQSGGHQGAYKQQKTGMPMPGMPRGYPGMPSPGGYPGYPPHAAGGAPGYPPYGQQPPAQQYGQQPPAQQYAQQPPPQPNYYAQQPNAAAAAQLPSAASDGGLGALQAQQYLQYAQLGLQGLPGQPGQPGALPGGLPGGLSGLPSSQLLQSFAGYDASAVAAAAAAASTYGQGYGASPAASGGGGYGQQQLSAPVAGAGGQTEQLVPQVMVGRLIGKGGSGIKEMREISQAQIKIGSDCEPGTDSRKVIVIGTPEQTQMALTLIQQRLNQGP